MIRNLLKPLRVGALFVSACCFLGANASWALGLGEIELDSALNERLDARIELLDASGLQPAEIIVSLATNEDFERVGVERFFFLTDLRFEVTYGAGGAATVSVTSSQAITEPYLNFLVEVLWPNGRLLKEFTLLLDPPTFSEAAAPVVSAPRQETASSESAGRVRRAETTTGTQVQVAPPAARPTSDAFDRPSGELMTDRDDTLWKIAERTLPADGITVHQNMLAIQRLNRNAFIRDNINLLKAGYVLRLPGADEARAVSHSQALAEVAAQNQDWRTGTSNDRQESLPQVADSAPSDLGGQLDARAEPAPAAPAAAAGDGELRILAGEGDSATGLAARGEAGDNLDAALEESDRLGREVDELTYQLDREKELAQSQLEVKDRQLEVKDQEVAQLQAQLAEVQQQLAAAQSGQSQNQSAAPKPDEAWWQSTAVMGGAAGVLVLALVGGLILARRRRETDDDFYAQQAQQEEVADTRVEPEFADDADTTALAEDIEDIEDFDDYADSEAPDADLIEDFASDDEAPDEDAAVVVDAEEESQGSQTGDVIAEADIYIAYGRYPQATGLLLGVLEGDPDRNDVRLKLLEIFAETHDKQSFDTHMGEFVDRCDDQEALLTARELETRLNDDDLDLEQGDAGAAVEADADSRTSNIEELGLADSAPAAGLADAGAADAEADVADELADIDFAALEETSEAAPETVLEVAPEAETEPETGLDLADAGEDFELEIDAADADEGGAGDQLGGDLGLDFDPDAVADEDFDLGDAAELPGEPAEVLEETGLVSEVATADEDDFDFDDEGDSANTKLDLARAYIDMGDEDGARDILKEVLDEGSEEQQEQAQSLLENL